MRHTYKSYKKREREFDNYVDLKKRQSEISNKKAFDYAGLIIVNGVKVVLQNFRHADFTVDYGGGREL